MAKLFVVGLGPGGVEQMTKRAYDALQSCDVIAGYNVYVNLIKDDFKDKEFLSNGMRKEVDRCKLALDEALKGKTVAMISSGDAGVYGMAGIMCQVAKDHPEIEIEVVPGITAACSGAAVLGAPLISDFCLISLSDLLTPWEKIEKRLDCASKGDFCICLYNPSSHKRHDYLQKACDIMLKNQPGTIPAGIVRNIGREGQDYELTTLAELRDKQVDMFSTVIIGNTQTEVINGRMVTPARLQAGMKPAIWLIGGTTEGRRLIKEMASLPVELYVSVATAYGATLIEPQPNLTVLAERMDLDAMRSFLQLKHPACVIDATHPYATVVTATVQQACSDERVTYLRLVRPAGEAGNYITVHDFGEAVELLNHLDGKIFLTTGSKNLPDFAAVHDFADRIALRVLPMESSLQTALRLGYKPANIVCMQGPFSKELNIAMLKKFGSKYMVTKDSGTVGGFEEKVEAAEAAGAKLIVIGRATQEAGSGYSEIVNYLKQHFATGN